MGRNVATMFFGFAFPVAFIAVFGLIGSVGFGGIQLGLVDGGSGPVLEAVAGLPGVSLQPGEGADLEQRLRRGRIDGVLRLEGDRVVLSVNSASPQSRLAPLWLQGAVDRLNLQIAGVAAPALRLEVQEVAGRHERYIDFALPGQIGMALLSTGIFGTVFGLIFLKKSLVLKRMFATPVRGLTILLGQGTARLAIALLQAVVILAFGVAFFGFQLPNGVVTFLLLLLLSAFGLVVFLGFGLFIAGWCTSEEAAGPIANLVTLPQFLLSGTFFSTEVFPFWLRPIADALPLSHLNAAMRAVATEGADLVAVAPQLAALTVWGVLAYVLATRTFRWY